MRAIIVAALLAASPLLFFVAWQAGVLCLILAAAVYGFTFGGPREPSTHDSDDLPGGLGRPERDDG